ncbi:MAG: hypothetical protein ACM3KL_00150 [Alphaproteobacteria bacterium]
MRKTEIKQYLRISTAVTLMGAAGVSAFLALPLKAIGGNPPSGPVVITEAALQPLFTTVGGAPVLPTTRTVAHWWGSTLNPHNGVIYGYNMVGANPNTCSGSECDVTVTVDIIPLNVVIQGMTFYGSNVLAPTLASPLFALNDYASTPFATAAGAFPDLPTFIRGPGGMLSQGDAGNQLQLEDATVRAQFNNTGLSSYHLRLNPVTHDPITIIVPGNQGMLLQISNGVIVPLVNYQWWTTQIQTFNNALAYVDPTHLPFYLTDTVLLYVQNPSNCCFGGFHGAGIVPGPPGPGHGNGDQPVQTYAWASWFRPGLWAFPDGGLQWAIQDILAIGHEIAEWASDPFINNYVQPPQFPYAPLIDDCIGPLLESGDPVFAIGFAMGTNTYDQGPNPDGTQSADGYYHAEDEAFLPWFMRLAPNNVSEPTQSPSSNIGRYTLMGDLNPFAGFHQPASDCN